MTESPIRSRAQHDMFKRALEEPDYAKSRGITQELAQKMLDGHAAAGSPELPSRITEAIRAELPPEAIGKNGKVKPFKWKLLGAK